MIYRVEVTRTVTQIGFVEIDAADEQDAKTYVEQEANGRRLVVPTWTQDISRGRIQVARVEAA